MTCAKRKVGCRIVTTDSRVFLGDNGCAFPQKVCPRTEGEGYEKCKSVCGQWGHAEQVAIQAAQKRGASLVGSTAYVTGHYHVCQNCANLLRSHGVAKIVIEVAP